MPESSVRALFAARLIQARLMRGLSQRVVGDRMGLGKEKGSSRINRYEHQVTAIGFDNLDKLAEVLGVPPAYLLADSPTMADVILALAKAKPRHQDQLMQVLDVLSGDPALTKVLLGFLDGSKPSSKALRETLQSLAKTSAVD